MGLVIVYGMDQHVSSLWMAFPSVSAPHFVSIFAPVSILLPLLRRIKALTLWSSFPLLSFMWSVNCILGILSFWANIHLSVSAYHVCSFMTELPNSGWYFQVPSICLRISSHCFNSWVVFHCVNIPHILYPFLCWRTSGFFPASGYYKYGCYKHSGAYNLIHFGTSYGYMPRSGIAGSSGSTLSNFLRNHQTDFQCGLTSLPSYQQWSVPLSPHPCQLLLSPEFFYLSYSDLCKIESQCCFDLHFPDV